MMDESGDFMITLDIKDDTGLAENKLTEYMEAHRNIFEHVVKGETAYASALGWFCVDEWAGSDELKRLEALAGEIRQNADAFVIIGVGGSNNGARAVIEALGNTNGPEIIYAGNTLSPHALRQVMTRVRGKKIYIDCIAKNFQTLEPGASFRILRKYMYDTYGPEEAAKRMIATGSRGSLLESLCEAHGYTFLEFPENVGGRFSAVTAVGLLPMAVAGVNIRLLVQGAAAMEEKLKGTPVMKNMACQYAALRNIYDDHGYKVEMLAAFEPQLRWFYKWWIQLFGESEGKDGRGLFPAAAEYSEELHAVGQYIQDGTPLMFETFLDIADNGSSLVIENDGIENEFDYLDQMDFKDMNRTAFEATMKAHSSRLPCLIFHVDRIDAWHFGQLFYFFMMSCYLSARLLGVHPFDQPGVEAYKKWMFDGLGKPEA